MKSNRKSPQRCSDLDGHFDRVTRLAALLPEPESIEDIDDIDSDILIMVAAEMAEGGGVAERTDVH
ncbi:MAG TPA: hypothetical protein VGJ76_03515 [Pseudolabrys sp.]|jgi:hypothetical protein